MSQPPPKRRRAANIAGHRQTTGTRAPHLGAYILTRAECEQVKLACRASTDRHGASARPWGCGRTRAAKQRAGECIRTPYVKRKSGPKMSIEDKRDINRIRQKGRYHKNPEHFRKYARDLYHAKKAEKARAKAALTLEAEQSR